MSRAQTAPQNGTLREHPPIYGPLTCASTSCHGGAAEQSNQYVIWTQRDVHARSYATLATARAARMAEALGIADATKSPRCTSCHAPLQTVEPRLLAPDARIADGVSCVSCHGTAEGWLRSHTRSDFTHADRVAAGMRELRNLAGRANACVACHQNLAPELVRVGRHPELIFELDGQTQAAPKHWREPAGRNAQAWFVGQAVALREMSWALRHGAADPKRERLRWAALHWLIRRTELRFGLPGAPVIAATGGEAPGLFGAAQEMADQLARRAAETWEPGFGAAVLMRLAGTSADFLETSESALAQACRAERLVLALDRLFAALPAEQRTAAASAQLDRLFKLAQSQPDFRPAEFARELEAFARSLK